MTQAYAMLCLINLLLFVLTCAEERVWKFDSDISNPANWIGGKPGQNCRGIHFSPQNSAPVFLKELSTQELKLPKDGELYLLDGGTIEFKSSKKCINLKPLEYHDWFDEDSWLKTKDNPAVPHKERIPCEHDDISFPKTIHSRVFDNMSTFIKAKSIKFGDLVAGGDLETFMETDVGQLIFFNPIDEFSFEITQKACSDPYGCHCHDYYIPCPLKRYQHKVKCLNPVEPEDFCHEICGAYVTFKPRSGFRLDNLREQLKKYSTDTHAGRVMDYLGNDVIQVVFTEKEYTGRSVEEAAAFVEEVRSEYRVDFFKSGEYYEEGGSGGTLGIVFGTFFAVVVFFGVVLYVNGDSRLDLIAGRFRRGRGSVFAVPFFARYDNIDENLIIESQSVSGSTTDLPKSFDNPLYGQSSSEDPLYDVELKEERDQDVEE